MTMPGQPPVDGAYVVGSRFGQDITEQSAKNQMSGGVRVSYGNAQDSHHTEYNEKIATNYTIAVSAQGAADEAVAQSSLAANTAAAAESTAASASARASYWESEFVCASAEVLLGVNELLIGLCQNVPGGMTRKVTDMHLAMLEQPNGMTFELRKWDALGTTSSVLGTYTLSAGTTRANWANLNFFMNSRERLYINVTSVTGTTPPTVLQILLFGVME
ncbi:hypothetical protein ACFRAQ_35160 [Nocardia sp. NPDC056611]|uniref:hypothetical protein n=1 Tax=Nocardia sp. NPDC056611 TaxID=3345877 RepID=UPI00366A7A65